MEKLQKVVCDVEPHVCKLEDPLDCVAVEKPSTSPPKTHPLVVPFVIAGAIAVALFGLVELDHRRTKSQYQELFAVTENIQNMYERSYIPPTDSTQMVFDNETLQNTNVEVFANEEFRKDFEDLLNKYDQNLQTIATKSAAGQANSNNNGSYAQQR